MACWLYQMSAKKYSHEQYRSEVWEGVVIQNWFLGESKRKPKEIKSGDMIILLYVRTNAKDPGIYGWGIVTWCDGEWIHFRPSHPSDYLKMNPVPEQEVTKVIDKIRGGMPEGTIFPVDYEELKQIRQKVAEHVYGISL
ncbi:MAG TPA: hypothetical protein VMW13_09010 [Dehalococcoidales bacterium]|nr:hypothetical protein [Dehalococcoidales bacterium]